jgi:type VI secretion system protein ImpC
MAEHKQMAQEAGTLEMSDFGSLLQKEFKPQSDKAKESVEVAVRTLAEQALAGTNLVSGDVLATIEGLIAASTRS